MSLNEWTKEEIGSITRNNQNLSELSQIGIAGLSGTKTDHLMQQSYNRTYGLDLAQDPSVDCTVTWPIGSVFKHSNAIYSPKPRGNGNIRIPLSLLGGALIGFTVACLIGGL